MRGIGRRMYHRGLGRMTSLARACVMGEASGDYLLYGRNHARVRGVPCNSQLVQRVVACLGGFGFLLSYLRAAR